MFLVLLIDIQSFSCVYLFATITSGVPLLLLLTLKCCDAVACLCLLVQQDREGRSNLYFPVFVTHLCLLSQAKVVNK